MMKISKYLAVASLALVAAACSNDETPLQTGEQVLTLRLADPAIARAIEAPVTAGAANFQDVTLKFWSDATGTTSAGQLVLTAAQINDAKTATGTLVKMPANTLSVSMVANTSVAATDITGYQALGTDFMSKVPMTSPAVAPVAHATIATAKQVTLVPTPDMARIEISGTITPAVAEGKTSAYKSVTVEAVYVNNYKATKDAEPTKLTATADWTSVPATMQDALADADRTALADKSKAVAYQLFPAENTTAKPDNLPHIVLKIKYVLNGNPEKTVENRYITIKGYKKAGETAALTALASGTIYKLDLAALNDKFATDDSGNPVDPTDETPEAEKSDLYVMITPYTWTAVNITPDL